MLGSQKTKMMETTHFRRARKNDPETSKEAAIKLKPYPQFYKIIEALVIWGPMGKDGIAAVSQMSGVQVARRLPELEKMGVVKQTGRTVHSNTGRKEREWDLNANC